MDENTKLNDSDNTSDEGIAIQVKTNQQNPPVVNDITPPPSPDQDSKDTDSTSAVEEMISDDMKNFESSDTDSVDVKVSDGSSEEDTNDIEVVSAPPDENVSSDTNVDSSKLSDENEDALSEELPETEAEPEEPKEEVAPKATIQSELESFSQKNQSTVPLAQSVLTSNNKQPLSNSAPAEVGISASQMAKHPHRNNKKLAAIVTVIVALVLAGTAVYVYLSANNNTEKKPANNATSSNQATTTQPEVEPATVNDIDTTTSEVEASINSLDESADFGEADLSDTTLGL